MDPKQLSVLLILLLILPLFLNFSPSAVALTTQTSPNLYFGVDVAFGSIAGTEQLINTVSSYTNFFVIGCTGNYNLTRLTIISQYVYSKGLSFIVYTDNPGYPSNQWLTNAKNEYGSSFQGLYYEDELGGKQIDQADYPLITPKNIDVADHNYTEAATMYVTKLNRFLRSGHYAVTNNFAYPTEFPLFTSDYALYWYDYEAGYNTVFAEFALNYSRQINIDLCRGAATLQNQNWGVMITWTYTQPPYMENGTDLYNDMVLAYNNGAKYIIIFDSDQNYTANVLQQNYTDGQGGQLPAMKQFWQYVQANPRTITPVSDRTAYVLPEYYGYGFRGPTDKIWGLWPNDSLTYNILDGLNMVMQKYGDNVDIIYPGGNQTVESEYSNVLYWNETLSTTPTPQSQQDVSLLSSTDTIYLSAIAASIIVVAAVTTALKFRKGRKKKLVLPQTKLLTPT